MADPADLAAFADTLARIPWFVAAGRALTDGERREVADYLAALGLADREIAVVHDWRAAEAVTRHPGWDRTWWDAEELARRALLEAALRRWGEHPLMTALTRVTDAATQVTLAAATTAAARDGIADPGLTRVAAGAATQAAYQAALARISRADTAHPFQAKFRLFAAGHWLLGPVGRVFHVF